MNTPAPRHVYTLSTIGTDGVSRTVTSTEIKARLRAAGARGTVVPSTYAFAAREWLAHVDDLEGRGVRYSNEDFDILSSALRAARTAESEAAKRGWSLAVDA